MVNPISAFQNCHFGYVSIYRLKIQRLCSTLLCCAIFHFSFRLFNRKKSDGLRLVSVFPGHWKRDNSTCVLRKRRWNKKWERLLIHAWNPCSIWHFVPSIFFVQAFIWGPCLLANRQRSSPFKLLLFTVATFITSFFACLSNLNS